MMYCRHCDIVHDLHDCPLCVANKRIDEDDKTIGKLEDEINELEQDIEKLENKISDLESEEK